MFTTERSMLCDSRKNSQLAMMYDQFVKYQSVYKHVHVGLVMHNSKLWTTG